MKIFKSGFMKKLRVLVQHRSIIIYHIYHNDALDERLVLLLLSVIKCSKF